MQNGSERQWRKATRRSQRTRRSPGFSSGGADSTPFTSSTSACTSACSGRWPRTGADRQGLAAHLGLHAAYVEVWCKTAYGLEILDADDAGKYRLAPYFDVILASPTHPRYLGGYVRLGTEVAAEDFHRCREAFRTGSVKPFQGRGDHFNQAIAESTQGLQVVTAKKILPGLAGLADKLAAGGAILEIGCGTGNFLLQVAKAFPKARCAGVDIDDDSLAQARQRCRRRG